MRLTQKSKGLILMKPKYKTSMLIKLSFLFVIIIVLSTSGYGATQLSQFGITWKFDKDYQAGHFVNGDWWVVGPVTIIEINPRSTENSGRTMHGSMLNPMASNDNLGYDSELKGYKPELNVALDVSASNPLTLQPHSSLVSTISVTAAAAKPQIDSAAVLTVLGAPAPEGSFRPPYCGSDKTIKFNKNQLNYSLLETLQKVPQTPRLKQAVVDGQSDSVERMFERPWIDHRRGWYARWIHPNKNMPDYQREMSSQIGEAALMLHLDYTNAEKETLLIRYVQLGIDLFGIVENGGWQNWEPDGGCGSGRKWPILFTGLVLGDPEMSAIGSRPIDDPFFGEDAQTFYVSQEDIDRVHTSGFANSPPEPSHDYSQEHLGMPEWGIRHATNPYLDNVSWGASYRCCCTANAWAGFVMACHITGTKGLWQHDALFDYMDRYMAKETPGTFNRQQSKFAEQMWDTYRANYGPVWPDTSSNQPPQADAGSDQTVTDSDGDGTVQITLNGSASSDADGTIVSYVWMKNGTQIATGVIPTVILTAGEHTIALRVTDDEGATDIDSVVITVETADTTPPEIISVIGTQDSVLIEFSETLDGVSAENINNYAINDLSIYSAALGTEHTMVTLSVSELVEAAEYTLTAANIRDAAGNPMPETVKRFFYNGGVVSHWRFDEGAGAIAQDSSEIANTAVLVNGPVWTTGQINGAIAFDGYDDAVEITTSNFNTDSGTIAFWAYPEAFLNTKNFLFGHATQPWSNRIQLYCNNQGQLALGLGDNSALNTNLGILDINRWCHITLLWDNPVYSVYIDGTQKASGTYSGLSQINDYADIANNGNPSTRAEAFDGIIDEVYVYNRPLTETEIITLINQEPEFLLAPIGNQEVDENSTLTFVVETTQPDVEVEVFEHNLPSEPVLNGTSFTWSPVGCVCGVYECTFKASAGLYEDFETISITVNHVSQNAAPVLAPIGNANVQETQTLTLTLSATDADGDSLSYSAANLPAGAVFSNHQFTWTPAQGQAGTYDVTFSVSDEKLTDSETVRITVTSAQQQTLPIYYSYSANRTGPMHLSGQTVSGDVYVFLVPYKTIEQVLFYLDDPAMSGPAFQAENNAPFDFAGGNSSIANAFDTTQLADGWHTISAAALLPDGNVEIGSVNFYVDNVQGGVNQAPMLDYIPEQTTEEAVELSFTVDAVDPDGDTLLYSALNLPEGAVFTNQTFRWTPAIGQTGVYDVLISVTDGDLTDSAVVSITVDEAPEITLPGLVGYWKLDETTGVSAEDQSASHNDGALINDPVWTNGKKGGAVSFDGNNDALEVTSVGWRADRGTVVLWAYPKGFYNSKHFLFGHATQPWSNRIQLYTDNHGNLFLGFGDSIKCEQRIYQLPLNTWTSIALTWNNGRYTVYVNASPVCSGTYSGLSTINSYCDIGNNGNRSTRSEAFDGTIDEVRVYNRALSIAEIMYVLGNL